jgi:hypothetical protein
MEGRIDKLHRWLIAILALVALGLTPTVAAATGSNDVSGATFLHFSKPDRMNLSSYTEQPGEMLTFSSSIRCDPSFRAWVERTALVGVYSGDPFSGAAGALVDCRFAASGTTSVTWPSVPGQRYLIQVGLCAVDDAAPRWCNGWPPGAVPNVDVVSRSAAPSYDTRAGAVDINPTFHYDNHGAQRENEINSCGNIQYGNTVWFKYTAPTWGIASFQLGLMTGVLSIRRAGSDAVVACGPGAVEAKVAKGETVWLQVGGDVQGTDTYLEGHFTLTPTLRDPDDDNDGTPNAGDCQPLDPAIHPNVPEIKDDGVDQNCVASDNKARKPSTSGSFFTRGDRLTTFALNEVLKGSRIAVNCNGPACRKRNIVVKKRLKRDVKRLNLPRRVVGPLRRGTRIRVEVTNPPEWMGRRFQWRMTSSTTYKFKSFCSTKKRWRKC